MSISENQHADSIRYLMERIPNMNWYNDT